MEEVLFKEDGNKLDELFTRIDEKKVTKALKDNKRDEILAYLDRYTELIRDVKEHIYQCKKKEGNVTYQYDEFMSKSKVEIATLEENLKAKKEFFVKQDNELKALLANENEKKNEELEKLEKELSDTIMVLSREKSSLEERYKSLKPVEARRKELTMKIEELETDVARLEALNADQLPKVEVVRDTTMKKHKEELELLKRDLGSEEERLGVAKGEYESFKKKKLEYEAQLKQQGDQINYYKIDNKKELNDYIKNEEALIEYKTLTFKQSSKIKELKDEIDLMNKKFPQEVAKYTKEIEFLKADIENKHSELEYKFQSMSDTLRVRHKESKQLRKYLQLVLDQRSELEHFFIEEIQNAVQQKARIRQAIIEKHGDTRDAQRMAADVMQFRWTERQEVIEKVFAKINSGLLPTYWRDLDTEDIKQAIIKEQERRSQIKQGIRPDDSETQRDMDKAIIGE